MGTKAEEVALTLVSQVALLLVLETYTRGEVHTINSLLQWLPTPHANAYGQ